MTPHPCDDCPKSSFSVPPLHSTPYFCAHEHWLETEKAPRPILLETKPAWCPLEPPSFSNFRPSVLSGENLTNIHRNADWTIKLMVQGLSNGQILSLERWLGQAHRTIKAIALVDSTKEAHLKVEPEEQKKETWICDDCSNVWKQRADFEKPSLCPKCRQQAIRILAKAERKATAGRVMKSSDLESLLLGDFE